MSGTKFDELPEVTAPTGDEKICVVDSAGDLKNMKLSTVLGQVPAPPTIPSNFGQFVNPPTSSGSPGSLGQFSADGGFIYVYKTGGWVRVAATSF
jgi:hypothetical protein